MAGSSEDPYRSPSQLPELLARPPTNFVYLAATHERRNGALRKMAGWLWLGAAGCVVVLVAAPQIGAWLLAGLAGFATYRWLQNRKPERIVVTVRQRIVEVALPSGVQQFELSRLRQIELDTKAIAKAYADNVVGTAVVSLGVMPAIDVSRIVLVVDADDEDDPPQRLVLGSDFEGSSEVTLWLGKLRVFFRKNGWIPADERDA